MTLAFWIYALILLESKSEYKINFWNLIFVKNAIILLAYFSNSSRYRNAIWKLFLFWSLKVSFHCHLTCIVLIDRSSIILILNPFVSLHGIFFLLSGVKKLNHTAFKKVSIPWCGYFYYYYYLLYWGHGDSFQSVLCAHDPPFWEQCFFVCCFMIILSFSSWNYCLLLEFWTESLIVLSNWLYFLSAFPSVFTSSI